MAGLPISGMQETKQLGSDAIIPVVQDGTNYQAKAETLAAFIAGMTPNYYERDELFVPERTSIIIRANTQVNIDGKGYISTEDVELDTELVREAGRDAYIYACEPAEGTEPVFVLSKNSTVPEGYNENNSRKIGGFHCLCESVGVIEGHPLSGYVTGDILPASVWDLKHRPTSDPEGMVYDEGTGRWYDIYLSSWDGEKLVSEFGGVPVTGTSATPMHGLMLKEKMGKVGKRLLWRHEFMCVADGSNQCTAIEGAANPGSTGGHVDSEGRRMISGIGLEDCCGCFWQWVNDEYEHFIWSSTTSGTLASGAITGHYSTTNNDTSSRYFSGYEWSSNSDATNSPKADNPIATYNPDIEDEIKGDSYGLPRQALVGGYWGNSSRCGSRAVYANAFGSRAAEGCTGRGASEPRVA